MICRVCASSGPKGSSMSRISGSRISIWARATRLRCRPRACADSGPRRPQADPAQPIPRLGVGLRPRHPLGLQGDRHVFLRRLPGHERVLLEEVAGAAVKPRKRGPKDAHPPARGPQQPGRRVQERGLAAARRTDDRHELARLHVEVDSLHGGVAPAALEPEGNSNIVQGDRGRSRRSRVHGLDRASPRRASGACGHPKASLSDGKGSRPTADPAGRGRRLIGKR
jgi:hypothetical protein